MWKLVTWCVASILRLDYSSLNFNFDSDLLDVQTAMDRFVRMCGTKPNVAGLSLLIDSRTNARRLFSTGVCSHVSIRERSRVGPVQNTRRGPYENESTRGEAECVEPRFHWMSDGHPHDSCKKVFRKSLPGSLCDSAMHVSRMRLPRYPGLGGSSGGDSLCCVVQERANKGILATFC